MKPIRVLQVFTIMNRGGAETMIMNNYRNIDRIKVQFDFMVHRQERGAYDDEIEAFGGRIYRMMPIHPNNLLEYKRKIHQFFNQHYEYQIIHGHCSELGVYIYMEASRKGIPVIIAHAHNSPVGWDFKTPFRFYWKHKMRRYITEMLSCGKKSSEWLFGKSNSEKAIILNNAIDANKFVFNVAKRERLKRELDIENKFVVGHVGRFVAQKNHKLLIDIFAEIHKRDKNAILLLIGDGDLKKSIQEKVEGLALKQAVKFLGVRSDIPDLLNTFDVFLLPSLFEGLPVTMVEAQASGLKCIVSDGVPKESGITDLVEYYSLNKSAEYWANEVLKYQNGYERKDMYGDIVNSGFDIKENAKWLQEYYLGKQIEIYKEVI